MRQICNFDGTTACREKIIQRAVYRVPYSLWNNWIGYCLRYRSGSLESGIVIC